MAIRGFGDGHKIFDDRVDVMGPEELGALPEIHAARMGDFDVFMVEIEFLDEPNEKERFFRFGTDPRAMVNPLAMDWDEFSKGGVN